jgi:2-methylcitrate dehydratase PrpD
MVLTVNYKRDDINMNGSDYTADFVIRTRWEGLSEPVRRQARMCLMDNLGATLAGSLTKVSQISADLSFDSFGTGESTILLKGKKSSPAWAAFANGSAANGIDMDDSSRFAYGHAGAQILPTALALSEALGLSGKQMLTAMVVGYEVASRVGRCWHDHHEIYQACGSWGSVACAAIAANLMGLNHEQTKQALGIAEYNAPNLPMMRDIDNPAMVKHGIGWAAMTGIVSADLAARGFTGVPSILGFDEYQDWVCDIGKQYIIEDGVQRKDKGYACCGWAHPGIRGAKQLMDEHGFEHGEIEHILVEAFHETVRLGTKLPSSTEEAQFNTGWPIAAVLVDGEVGPDQILEARLKDPVIRALVQKIELVETEELNALNDLYKQGEPGGRFAGKVTISLKNGNQYHSGLVDGGIGFPQPNWDEERVEEKFRWLAGKAVSADQVDSLVEMLWDFENVENLSSLTDILA